MARLLAHSYSTLLRSFSETAGTSQSLVHYNPTAQSSWQRPLLLVQPKASLRRHSSYSDLRLRPGCSGHSHSQETQHILACGAPMDNQLILHDRPRRSVPGGLTTTHLLHPQTPPSASCHPLGLRPFGIQPCHRLDTRICAQLGPGLFCGRSLLSPPRLPQSRPPYFMAWPGG